MQEYSRNLFNVTDPSLDKGLETENKVSLDFHKSTAVERQDANRAKGLSFGSMGADIINSFYAFWQNLIVHPESNKGSDKTPLTSLIIKKEGSIYESNFLHEVLAENLQLVETDPEVDKAVKQCTKIYHEDYPGSYVLAYQGKRLGICFLNVIKGVNNTVEVSYQFNSKITRFS